MIRPQYALVKDARKTLLAYCATIAPEHFLMENSSFGRGSMRNLLVHVADTYRHWIGNVFLQKDMSYAEVQAIASVSDCRVLFADTDVLMEEFMDNITGDLLLPVQVMLPAGSRLLSPLQVFTHVITHEFHHKGQLLSLSRHLGYVPVDTDIIR